MRSQHGGQLQEESSGSAAPESTRTHQGEQAGSGSVFPASVPLVPVHTEKPGTFRTLRPESGLHEATGWVVGLYFSGSGDQTEPSLDQR